MAKIVPPRFNEGWGTWHAKIYGSDDEVMISGSVIQNPPNAKLIKKQSKPEQGIFLKQTRSLSAFHRTTRFCRLLFLILEDRLWVFVSSAGNSKWTGSSLGRHVCFAVADPVQGRTCVVTVSNEPSSFIYQHY
jgi:hypothetical protein